MRRRGVPCGCADNGGCCGLKEKLAILWDRTIGSILSINHTTPDGDGDFTVQGGDNIEVSTISNGVEIGLKNPLTEDVTIQADLTVDGDITQNDQPVATRDESTQLVNNHLLKWNSTDLMLVDSGIDVSSLGGGLELVDTLSSQVFLPNVSNADETYTINMGPFEAGYDYFLFIYTAGGENANIRAKYDIQTIGTTAIDLKIQTATMVTFNARLYRCPTDNPLISNVRLSTIGSSRTNDQQIIRKTSVTILSSGWNNNTITVAVPNLKSDDDVFVNPDPAYWSDWTQAGVRAMSQTNGYITLACDTTPTLNMVMNLVIGRLSS